ncbi:MAG: 3'-5' exonuclease domain-containing protein 2 [Dysgonamonadaceae bacterium]|nr:3'-5' exonuclease domain-containing protein 2 [Dysgonamonadaceae bacterium]
MSKTITKEEISRLPIEEFSGEIHIIESLGEAISAIEYLSRFKELGFDTETRPTFKKGNMHEVALIQLATDNSCFLFRLNKIGFPEPLVQLLSNHDTMKIGLSLRDDFHSMKRRIKFIPQGFIELQKMIADYDIADTGLQKIYALLFSKRISKKQRLTNWEADTLSEAQKKYAALDAWACLKIYRTLCHIKEYI